MNSFERFKEKSLPSIESFYSHLKDEGITEDEYKYAQTVMTDLNIQDMGEYTDVYLKTDACLLADVFEEFRKMSLNDNKLDPAIYISAPGFFNDGLYFMTKQRIENITD